MGSIPTTFRVYCDAMNIELPSAYRSFSRPQCSWWRGAKQSGCGPWAGTCDRVPGQGECILAGDEGGIGVVQAVYYRDRDGHEPVNDYIDGLSPERQEEVDAAIALSSIAWSLTMARCRFPIVHRWRANFVNCGVTMAENSTASCTGVRTTSSSCCTLSKSVLSGSPHPISRRPGVVE